MKRKNRSPRLSPRAKPKMSASQQIDALRRALAREKAARKREVGVALDQQAAMSEVLRVISTSPADLEPVAKIIANSAARLCNTPRTVVFRFDGTQIHFVAAADLPAKTIETLRNIWPRPAEPSTLMGRTILSAQVLHIEDVTSDPSFTVAAAARPTVPIRTFLGVPMLQDGRPIGAIALTREEVAPFSKREIELIKTFADQAVITIENVQLFTEVDTRNRDLRQALDRETATGEILRVINGSPTSVEPVFDAILANALRLSEADVSLLFLVDADTFRLVADRDAPAEFVEPRRIGFRSGLHTGLARAVRERRPVQIADLLADRAYAEGDRNRMHTVELLGARTGLWVPMLRQDVPVGVLVTGRREVRAFSDAQVDVLKTFADQAVIAVENVRLFTELQSTNRDLTVALDQQTTTAEILRVISRSQTDVRPVFEAIAENGMRLFHAWSVGVWRLDGHSIHHVTRRGRLSDVDYMEGTVRPLDREFGVGRCLLDRAVLQIPDVDADPGLTAVEREVARHGEFKSIIFVPMLRDGDPIGLITVTRQEVGGFTPGEIALLQTFADQAVIAIENARLLGELQARTAELTRSVDELTALGDVSRALSSTLNLEIVLRIIVTHANELAGAAGCTIWEYDDGREEFRLRVSHYADERDTPILGPPDRITTIPKGHGVTTRIVNSREPVQIPDIAAQGAYESPIRSALLDAGHRTLLGVPLLSEDEVVGVLAVTRKTPGEFSPEIVQLLSTFATQSALAIQNARLFQEIEDKSRQLEIASQHKSEFLASMSHELRTPLNAIIGFSDVLLEKMFGELNDKQTEYLHDILTSGQHLLSLINDILDLSKIEAGRMELDVSEFDLPQAIDDALMLMRERAIRRGIMVDRSIDARLGEIRADERKVKQVLLNLLSNAVKFTREGGRIDVRAAVGDGGGVAEISVTDTGVGIAPEDHDAVFEEFTQVGSISKKVEGTGLGLALCRKFVELHGGRIWVKSQVGQGSTFTFTLPLRGG